MTRKVQRSRRHSPPFLSLREATFRLGDDLIFEGTTWNFEGHHQWAIVGANGSGKSLFADALRGRLPLVHGVLQYHFKTPTGMTQEETIGHVSFEDRKANVHETVVQSRWNSLEEREALKVREFLSYQSVMQVNPYEVQRADEQKRAQAQFARRLKRALRLLRVEELMGRILISLSNGEMQRVQIAHEICRPLGFLILDEPFTGMDAQMRKYFREVLNNLMVNGLKVLVVTAQLEDLPRAVTHVLNVKNRRVAGAGTKRHMLATSHVKKLSGGRRHGRIFQVSRRSLKQPAHYPLRKKEGVTEARANGVLLRMRSVSVSYGSSVILRGIDWVVREGESWALLGPNGSGKSTLLSLVMGDHPQVYANQIEIFGEHLGISESVWELKQKLGWVSPELQVHFDDAATCFEVVASGLHDTIGLFQPVTRSERFRVMRSLAEFDLAEVARIPLYGLSGGQQRMALLARALVKKPRLLLLDEPCLGLDGKHRDFFVTAIERLIRSGTVTVVYVTHRTEELPVSIRRVLRLENGRATVEPR